MGLFRKNTKSSQHSGGSGGKPKLESITKDDVRNYKVRTGSVHDPILAAVNEQQPFEAAAQDQYLDGDSSRHSIAFQSGQVDVFGKPINRPDISNPTRSRDERPLDTIRGFEYSITGDSSYRERLETDALGFRVRDDFPRFGANPYNYDQQGTNQPVHSFSADQQAFEQGVYQSAPKTADSNDKKKKKKGLFGRKKKSDK